jgi:hypothetical protein
MLCEINFAFQLEDVYVIRNANSPDVVSCLQLEAIINCGDEVSSLYSINDILWLQKNKTLTFSVNCITLY